MKKKLIICISAGAAVVILAAAALICCFCVDASLTVCGEDSVNTDVFADYEDEGAAASFMFFDISSRIKTDSDVDCERIGEYTVTYMLELFGRTYEAERSVTVTDLSAPTVTLTDADADITVSAMKFFKDPGYSAVDNYDGDVTDKVTVTFTEDRDAQLGTVTYTVADSSGNEAVAQRKVTVKDIVAPVITLSGGTEMSINSPAYTEPGYTASDDLDGDITSKVSVTSDYVQGKKGKFTFTYSVSDEAGNTASAVRTVTVSDTTGPYIKLNGPSVMFLTKGSGFTDPGAAAADDFDGAVELRASGSPDTSATGTYYITYSAADKSGNISELRRTVTVYEKPAAVEGAVNGEGIVSGSTIYLTFDDGPSSSVTPRILDILSANGIKATFFIVNYSNENKALISRMIAEGHTVAIHGYSHDYRTIYSSVGAFVNNIDSLHKRLVSDFGYSTDLIRFPGGSSNMVSRAYAPGIMTELTGLMGELGYHYFDWNVSSGDAAGGYVSSQTIVYNVTSSLRHGRGNIVLMHDTNAKSTTADALQSIIDYGCANGYTFAALSSYTDGAHHHVQN